MSSAPLEARVVTLEQAMAQLALAQASAEKSLEMLTQDTQAFKDEMRASSDRADRRWGELANKMGTLVEDIVAPCIPAVFQSVFRQEAEPEWGIRQRRRHDPARRREFDAVAWGGGVFLAVQTKSALSPEDIGRFTRHQHIPEVESWLSCTVTSVEASRSFGVAAQAVYNTSWRCQCPPPSA